ncbi:MAG: HlyD family secretion protein, partial [Brevundimonas sp.]
MTDAPPAPTSAPAQAPATPAAPPPSAPAAAPQPSTGRRVMISVVLILIALVGVGLILHAWRLPPFDGGPQTTDNAYVRGQVTVISPQVSGYVTSVEVQDFQTVQQGQLLV